MAKVLIDKEELLETLKKNRRAKNGSLVHLTYEDAIEFVEKASPVVKEEPIKRGRWIQYKEDSSPHELGIFYKCSVCGAKGFVLEKAICPDCHALMYCTPNPFEETFSY